MEHVFKKRGLIGLLLSRAGREPRLQAAGSRAAFSLFPPASYSLQPTVYSLFLGTSASPIAAESLRPLAEALRLHPEKLAGIRLPSRLTISAMRIGTLLLLFLLSAFGNAQELPLIGLDRKSVV